MSVQLTGDAGLFTRIGRAGRILYELNSAQTGLTAAFDALDDQYEDTLRDTFAPVDQAQEFLTRAQSNLMSTLASVAAATLLRMVTADAPTVRQFGPAVFELIRQMRVNGDSVPACTVSATATALTPFEGDGVLVVTTKRGDGLEQENLFAEAARVVCTGDSYTQTATAGEEAFEFRGADPGFSTVFDWDYPRGSGAVTAFQATDADNSLLSNGGFEDFTSSAPDDWTAATGTFGVNMLEDSTALRGDSSLRFAAGATLSALYQTLADEDTASVVQVWTSYALNLWCRTKTGTASTGVLTVELVDDAGTVINDEQGTANSFTVTLTALTTSWSAHSGVFRLPAVPPATVRLRLRLSTVLAGADLLVDGVCLVRMTAGYPGGPALAAFSGATPFAVNDGWELSTANDRAGSAYLSTWQALFDRLFGMRQLGLLLPTSGSPTVGDDLITDPPAVGLDFARAADSQYAAVLEEWFA